ncbi:MAG: heparinase II/III family protein [Phenylobacterium sp.]|uniref:heparinase II/III family protein n=1 Tax=Phenylobacterium sp. TaxID=1871053 RepID=UPI00273491D9|nr:heparinase II/III family protein [Phenylobacterium sp.]MDP3749751.1 heparinase II/III family protein [Phenylobacterium sp.]
MAGGPPAIFDTPGGAWALALAEGGRRALRREWAGTGLHRWLLSRPRAEGLAGEPKDPRPADLAAGRRILAGRFEFGGASLEAGVGGDPWDRPSPSRRFAAALHRFDWSRDLIAVGDDGAAEALRLTLDWRRLFGRWNGFAWSPEVLERRVFNLACAAKAISAKASDAEAGLIAQDLARQARHLAGLIDGPVRAAERACSAALAGGALAGDAGEDLIAKGLSRLQRVLPVTVRPDGGHASRCPRAALELLFDLQALDEALVHRGIAPPDEMLRAIDRLAGAVRFFTLADGGLPDLQGGEGGTAAYVSAARASEGASAKLPTARNGYQRLEGRSLQVIADAGPPARGPWSVTACAQPLAMELLIGGRRVIVACAWSPDAVGPPALRTADAGSTATLGDQACGAPLGGFRAGVLGPRLVGAYDAVDARRQEAEGAVWLELAHDGWARRFGLRHERRLYLDLAADELRGEDRFLPARPGVDLGEAGRRFVPFTVRFHLHPDVKASLARDGKSVLLQAGDQEHGWWLRNDANDASVEPSVFFQDSQPRRAQQVVLRGQARVETGARIRWKLAAADIWPPPQ